MIIRRVKISCFQRLCIRGDIPTIFHKEQSLSFVKIREHELQASAGIPIFIFKSLAGLIKNKFFPQYQIFHFCLSLFSSYFSCFIYFFSVQSLGVVKQRLETLDLIKQYFDQTGKIQNRWLNLLLNEYCTILHLYCEASGTSITKLEQAFSIQHDFLIFSLFMDSWRRHKKLLSYLLYFASRSAPSLNARQYEGLQWLLKRIKLFTFKTRNNWQDPQFPNLSFMRSFLSLSRTRVDLT